MFEQLESRRLFTTIVFPGTTGADVTGNDSIGLFKNGSNYAVLCNGIQYNFSGVGVTDFKLSGGDGNDSVSAVFNAGANTIAIPGTIYGNGGNDTLQGALGADVLEGGAGTDVLFQSPNNDTLIGGSGTDSSDFTNVTGTSYTLSATLDGVANDVLRLSSVLQATYLLDTENLAGTAGNDTLTGNASANEIVGFGGDDVLFGQGGNDILRGGDGLDTLSGEGASDTLYGDAGNDYLIGGSGTDSMRGGIADDFFDAQDGASGDVMFGEAGTDSYIGDVGDTFTQ